MRRQNGFSLIEMLIAMAMMTVTSLVFASQIAHMNAEIRAAKQKTEALEIRQVVAKTLSELPICSCQLQVNSGTFDTTDPSPLASTSEIRSTCTVGAPIVIRSNAAVPGSLTQLKVDQIEIMDIQWLGIVDKYRGKLHVPLESDGGRTLAGFDVDIFFTTTGPANAKQIVSCDFVSAAGIGSSSISGVCPSGQYVTGITSGTIQCSAVAVNGGVSNTKATYSLASPGPGCVGTGCITGDYGPCIGSDCITNGNSCQGSNCVACGPSASCTGTSCCGGSACPGC